MVRRPSGLLLCKVTELLPLILKTCVCWLFLAVILELLLSGNSWSAISFIRSGGTTGTSFSMDIGSVGTDRLVVIVLGNEGSEQPSTQASVDGKNCNLVVKAHNTVGLDNHQEMWYCDEDDLGSSSGTVTVSFTSGDGGWAIHAHLYTGAGQSGPTDSEIDETSASTNTITVTGIDVPANGLVVMGAGQGSSGSASSWTSPLTERTDGPDPSSAVLATASAIESSAQTNKTYVCTMSVSFNRGTGIVAAWPQSGGDVTVSSIGNQISSLNIPSTDNYVGGTFVITDNAGSRNVTGITITENGTVDAQNDLANVKLFYDLDATSPYDCVSETYGGSESQFGSTTSFNGANGTASFTGSVSISTTQTMCIYTVLNVGSGASDGETLEIEINNPSSDVTISSGSITTNTAFVRSGGTTGTSFSMDIGSAGTNRLVVVTADDESDGNSLTGVTVDSKSCTKVTEADNPSGPGNHLEMWYCDEDDLGSSSGSVTISIQGGNGGWATHAHLYTGLALSGPTDSGIDESSTSSTTVTVTGIDVSANGLVVMGAGHGSSGTGISSWTSPLATRQDGPDPSSAEFADASAFESSAQTNKAYVATFSGSFNRGTGIVASWAPENSVALSGTTTLRVPLNLNDFTDCKKITIDNTKVSGSSNYSNFPVLVSLTEDYLKTTGNGGSVTDAEGDDIVFIDSDGSTQLDHEVEKYVTTTGEYIPWVEVPALKYNEDTIFYMYYGNSNITTSQENVTGVWDSNFKGVWHMNEDPGPGGTDDIIDSTSNNNHGTADAAFTSGDLVSGQIGNAINFDGGSEDITDQSTSNIPNIEASQTFSFWYQVSSNPGGTENFVVTRPSGGGSANQAEFRSGNIGMYQWGGGTIINTSPLTAGSWRYFVWTNDGTTNRLYLDGSLATSNTTSLQSGTVGQLYFSTYDGSNESYTGQLDEIRISSTNRSTDGITTEYNNQSSPATFYSVGACSGSATIINWQESF